MLLPGDGMNYIDRVRELREDRDLTQTDVASLLNIGQKTYSDYELGKTRIPLDSMLILAKYYNVSMDYLSGASDIKTEYPPENNMAPLQIPGNPV
jgi:transcriptional regulator with XRE-family HTH domain